MRFAFTEEQLQIRDAVRDALASACPPNVVRAAWADRDTSVQAALADLGVLGVNAHPDAGGMGLGAVDWVLLLEEAGRVAAPLPLVEIVALNPTLAELGRMDLLADVVSGSGLATVAPTGGFAVDADVAGAVFVLDGGTLRECVSPILTREHSVDGSRRLFGVAGPLQSVRADVDALQLRLALASAATLIGLARQMLDLGVAYAKDRRQFGKPIGSFQAVQHHLVDALSKIAFAAPAVYRAAWSLDVAHPNRAVHVAMAKLYASEAATFTAKKSLQVHGAIGYTFEYDLHLWMKRAWALSAAWGDPATQIDTVAHHLLNGGDDA